MQSREQHRRVEEKYRAIHREEIRERKRRREKTPEERERDRAYARAYYLRRKHDPVVRAKHAAYERQKRIGRTAATFAAYGGKCQCCGESHQKMLSIDHVNGDGKAHRKALAGRNLHDALKRDGYPQDGYRLLCFNCNIASFRNGGICPHQDIML